MKMKKLLVLIICVGGIVLLEANPAQPATLEVRPPSGMGTLGDVYTNIQQAIDDASPGDTISVADGTYEEDLAINVVNLTLESKNGPAVTIIKGVNTLPWGSWPLAAPNIEILAGGVSIYGFTIESPDVPDGNYSSGIVLDGTNIEIYDNNFVSIGAGDGGCVVAQTYRDNVLGYNSDISGLSIHNNSLEGTPGGTYVGIFINHTLTGAGTVTIQDNELTGSIAQGIVTERSNAVITGNTLTASGSGDAIILLDWGPSGDQSDSRQLSNVAVTGNNIANFGRAMVVGNNIHTQVLTGISITNNDVTGNTTGILVRSSADGVVANYNKITGNGTYGTENTDAAVLDATLNWWGDATGPYHATTNPSGLGNAASDNVNFEPWYTNESMLNGVVVKIGATEDIRALSDTIQGGIDVAYDGDTVVVAAGTYDEQIFIDKNLTLIGAGAATTTIRAPEGMTTVLVRGGAQAIQGVVNITGASAHGITVDVNGFTIDGNYEAPASSSTWFAGIVYSNADGTIVNNIITKVRQETLGEGSASWRGHGVWLGDASTVTVKQNTISQWQRNGVEIRDAAATATITDNTFIGYETPYTVVNAVTFYFATDGTASRNTVTDCRYTGSGSGNDFYSGTQACAIMSYEGSGTFTVSDNTIQDCDMGIYSRLTSAGVITGNTLENNLYFGILFRKGDVTAIGNTITGSEVGILIPSSRPASSSAPQATCNNISGNSVYGIRNDAAYLTDATSNWWGSVSGPSGEGGGAGDAVSENVEFFPWLLTDNIEDCAELTEVAPDFVVDDDWEGLPDYNTVNVGDTDYYIGLNAFDTIQGAVDAASDSNSISVAEGEYFGATINEDLTIIGANPGGSVITDGPHYGGGHPTAKTAFKVDADADGLEIKNFTIDCNAADNFYFAIFSRAANDVVVDSLTVNDPVQGITNYGGSSWQITNNLLNYTEAAGGGGIAIYLGTYPPDYVVLHDNIVKGNTIVATATAPDFTCPGICMALDLRYDRYDLLTGNEDISYNMIVNNDITGTGAASEVGIELGVIGLEGDPNKIAATLGLIHDNTIRNNIIHDTDWGIYFYTVSDTRILGNEIIDCNNAIYIQDSHKGTVINYNAIYGSDSYGVNNTGSVVVDATHNWWGDVSGPNDPVGTSETDGVTCYDVGIIKNADGLGDAVTDELVDYCSWLTAPVSPSDSPYTAGDLDYDGCVNFADVAILADEWLEGCEE